MGHESLSEFLQYHVERVTMWRNRNCLLKFSINHKKTELFKNISPNIFREIIKYAWFYIIKDIIIKILHSFLIPSSSSYMASMMLTNSLDDLSRSLLSIRCLNICHSWMHSAISPEAFSTRFSITSGLSVFLFSKRWWSSPMEGGHTNMKLVSGNMACIFLAP